MEPGLYNNDYQSKWATDITYIHTRKDGWTYLSTIQDLHTKKIIGWKYGKQMTVKLVLDTLEHAY
ncbi:DDE-type integrase/transposase/recombinase [Agrilactobacillus fermenti]|uniref:DDE-type integrase/transposase/recombinase n=1 Tax=Agrilactobacillus fermenti TaxID=2586909 RepID=UPI003A5C69C4